MEGFGAIILVIFIVGMGYSVSYKLKCRRFHKAVNACKYGIADLTTVKEIMKEFPLETSGYNRYNELVISYKIQRYKSSKDYESVTFLFDQNDVLCDISTGYHRTTTTTYYQ